MGVHRSRESVASHQHTLYYLDFSIQRPIPGWLPGGFLPSDQDLLIDPSKLVHLLSPTHLGILPDSDLDNSASDDELNILPQPSVC